MNLSPRRIPGSPLQQGKPKVSFIYQNQGLAHCENAGTPSKPSEKQNIFFRPNIAPNIHVTHQKVLNASNISRNNMTPSRVVTECSERTNKEYNSIINEGVRKFPPTSPKINKKTSVPSFIANKANKEQNDIKKSHLIEQVDQLCKCGKNATHSDIKTKEKFCTKCGVTKMINGGQLQEYSSAKKTSKMSEPQVSTFSETSSHLGSSIVKQPPREMELEQFLKDLEEEKKGIQKFYENTQHEDRHIHQFFKDKKIALKSHYEKIKAAIKESIERDLKELTEMQKDFVEEWQNSRAEVSQDLEKISKIEQDVRNNLEVLLKESDDTKYSRILNKSRTIMSKISTSQANLTANNFCSSRLSENSLESPNSKLYEPESFRMIEKKPSKIQTSFHSSPAEDVGKKGVLFSFQKKH